jgi:hypothetical protein
MAVSRSGDGPVEPVPAPSGLDSYEGLWVAVKDGNVIEAAETSSQLVFQLRRRGETAKGAVMMRAPKRTDAIVVGLG